MRVTRKRTLKSLSLSYQKKDGCAHPSFVMTPTDREYTSPWTELLIFILDRFIYAAQMWTAHWCPLNPWWPSYTTHQKVTNSGTQPPPASLSGPIHTSHTHIYVNWQIYIRSTDVDRTLMSAQSVMAGLYSPPQGDQLWNHDIPWTPVPIHSEPQSQDYVSIPWTGKVCAAKMRLLRSLLISYQGYCIWVFCGTQYRDSCCGELSGLK